jgi:ATP-dependent Zn protease
MPRGQSLGLHVFTRRTFNCSSNAADEMCATMGGRAAEKISTILQFKNNSKTMVTVYG